MVDLIPISTNPKAGSLFTETDLAPNSPNTGAFDVQCQGPPTPANTPTNTPTYTPTPTKTRGPDTDQDGCTDDTENGPDQYLGGQRDFNYFWDFYDVWTHPLGQPTLWERDRVVNLPGDIVAVAIRFGANDAGPGTFDRNSDPLSIPNALTGDNRSDYHPSYDRSPLVGPNLWDKGPPDGTINVPDDIFGVMAQFGTNCA